MADLTNFPELTDEMLQKFIGHALQQATREDTRSPLSSGLLSAGLAMMAGSRGRSFGEALGQGGLLGLQAYGAQKELAKKDPTQMISLLTAIEGLKEQKAGRDWMKSMTPTTGLEPLQFQPAPGLPQNAPQQGYGMFSRDDISPSPNAVTGKVLLPEQQGIPLGQMVPPPSVGGYQVPAGAEGMNKIWGGIGFKGRPGTLAEKMLDVSTKAPAFGPPGSTPMILNPKTLQYEAGPPLLNLDKGMRPNAAGTGAEEIPNYGDIQARFAGLTEAAKERGKLTYTPATTPQAGGGSVATTGIIDFLARQYNADTAIVREVMNNPDIPEAKWGPAILALKAASGGAQSGTWKASQFGPGGDVVGVPSGPQGPGLQPPQTAPQLPPRAAPATGRGGELYGAPSPSQQALEQQQLLLPGEKEKQLASDAFKAQVADLKESYKVANAARAMLESINESRSALTDPVIVGGFAKGKIEGLNMVNGLLPAKYQISTDLLGNSQRLASSLGGALVAHATDLGSQPSNADAKRLEKVIGDEGLSEKGIRAILDFQEKMARQVIDQHNRIAKQAAGKGAAPLFDYTVEAPEAFKAPEGKQAAPTGPPGKPPAMGATWDEQRRGWVIKSGNKIYDWK